MKSKIKTLCPWVTAGKDFLDMLPKIQAIKEQVNKLDLSQ
jgi:hypothetical protein